MRAETCQWYSRAFETLTLDHMFLVFDWASAGNLSRSLCLFTTLIISCSICPLSPPRNVLPPATGGHVESNSTSTSALNQDLMKRHLFRWTLNITSLFRPGSPSFGEKGMIIDGRGVPVFLWKWIWRQPFLFRDTA